MTQTNENNYSSDTTFLTDNDSYNFPSQIEKPLNPSRPYGTDTSDGIRPFYQTNNPAINNPMYNPRESPMTK